MAKHQFGEIHELQTKLQRKPHQTHYNQTAENQKVKKKILKAARKKHITQSLKNGGINAFKC